MNGTDASTHEWLPPSSGRDDASVRTALILSGGGSRGAVQVGFYKALQRLGVPIRLIFGSSIGAINGALIAAGFSAEELEAVWTRFEGKRLFELNWQILWRGWKATSLYRRERFLRSLGQLLPVQEFDDLHVPLVVTATDLRSAQPVYLDQGSLVEAIAASTALPPFFAPVRNGGRLLVDGGILASVPIVEAARRGADQVIGIRCECFEELAKPPRGVLETQAQAFRIAVDHRLRHEIEDWRDRVRIHLFEPCFEFPSSILRVERVRQLVEESYRYAMAELPRALAVGASTRGRAGPAYSP